MAKSALLSFISLIHGDKLATIAAASEAFTSDYGHFARANNRDPLNDALKALKKTVKDKAIAQAINDGYTAGNLPAGYIGATTGKLSAQSDDVQAKYELAVVAASEAFKASLEASEAFAEKVAKTQEEKIKAKEEKAVKANEALENAITARVQAGELVRASDVKPYPQNEIDSLKARIETLQAENETLHAENETLRAALATVKSKKQRATA